MFKIYKDGPIRHYFPPSIIVVYPVYCFQDVLYRFMQIQYIHFICVTVQLAILLQKDIKIVSNFLLFWSILNDSFSRSRIMRK